MEALKFFVGLHHTGDARHFPRACLSVRWLHKRKKPLGNVEVFLDSGAFTELSLHGEYKTSVETHAATIHRLHTQGIAKLAVVVCQDYMCEPFMLEKTGLTIPEHQQLSVERFDALVAELHRLFGETIPFPVMPVLQGFEVEDYLRHLTMYGDRITHNMWVGVGSVCKRQGNVTVIENLLRAIKQARPDIRLHGFGVKITALLSAAVRELLHSADSMAWSFSARKQGRDANDWREAEKLTLRIAEQFVLDLV